MAHFAQLDENNIVTQVIVVNNNELSAGSEVSVVDGFVKETHIFSEEQGIAFCQSLFGADTKWVQTSYNGNFRGKYAGIGDIYDTVHNVFVSPVITPVVEPVVAVEATQDIPTLTSSNVSALSSVQIAALNTSDLQSLTTSGL